jgi:chondroitin AC lyase
MWEDVTIKPPGGQGIQDDWSYHFHGRLLLSGSYGSNWASDILSFFACSYQTQYGLDSDKLLTLAKYLTKGNTWMIIGNHYDWLAVGREIDRIEQYTVTFNTYAMKLLAKSIPFVDIKIELDNLANRLEKRSNASLLIGNKHFYATDYQLH